MPTFEFLEDTIQISVQKYQIIQDAYAKFGDFDFMKCKTDHLEHTEEFYQIFGFGTNFSKWIYIGQLISEESSEAQGLGILIMQSGQLQVGTWVNDLLEGYGRFVYMDDSYYEGWLKHSKLCGYGKHIKLDGTTHIGYFFMDRSFGERRICKEDKVDFCKTKGLKKITTY